MNSNIRYRLFEFPLVLIGHLISGVIIGISLLPSILFLKYLFTIFLTFALNFFLSIALKVLTIGIAYFIFGYVLLASIVFLRIVFRIKSKEENIKKGSLKLFYFATYSGLLVMADHFFLPLIRNSYLINWFYRGMGAKIGKNTLINTTKISDCNLIEIGNNCVIGGDVVINGYARSLGLK